MCLGIVEQPQKGHISDILPIMGYHWLNALVKPFDENRNLLFQGRYNLATIDLVPSTNTFFTSSSDAVFGISCDARRAWRIASSVVKLRKRHCTASGQPKVSHERIWPSLTQNCTVSRQCHCRTRVAGYRLHLIHFWRVKILQQPEK